VANNCLGCTCQSARTASSSGYVLLSTQVSHTLVALRALVSQRGLGVQLVAPGLLAIETEDADTLIADAGRALSSVEADEVRCVVLDGLDLSDASVVARAMSAPTLAAAAARIVHSDLVPLFDDEARCFHSVYQPIIGLHDGLTVGYEALLRAETPDGDTLMPDALFGAAEAAGWIHLLDRVGRTVALRDAGSWLRDELLFINFIPTAIYRPEVCLRTTEAAAAQAGVRLSQLVFEVTEGQQIPDVDHLERVFAYYRSHQCKVALDDLGSGYSGLNLLVRLKPDIVKLDKELVQGLPAPASKAVVGAIVEIAHSYGGSVLAECVETTEQADAALALGVDLAQGWLFGRPQRRNHSAFASAAAS
jgi:EAL domain-containing protein (putative c-di-GMP-specific phosphodiesterase class I)